MATVDGADLFSADQAYETVGKAVSEYLPRTLNKGEISVEETGGKTDWFYPDFIGELDDGRLFVLEYKGKLTGQSEDTVEKDAIGKLWAAQDPKKYVYATIYGDAKSGLSPEQQVSSALT